MIIDFKKAEKDTRYEKLINNNKPSCKYKRLINNSKPFYKYKKSINNSKHIKLKKAAKPSLNIIKHIHKK